MTKFPEVIIIRESILGSLARDAGTVATFVSLISIGVYLESSAMQWVGAIVGFITIWSRVLRAIKDNRMTTDEARKMLDEIDGTALETKEGRG